MQRPVKAVAGVLCVIAWHVVGHAHLLWLAGSAVTYGLVTVGAGHVLPLVVSSGQPAEVLVWLHPASRGGARGRRARHTPVPRTGRSADG